MAKGNYPGSGTTIRLGDGKTGWIGSSDPAEDRRGKAKKGRLKKRPPTAEQIEARAQEDFRQEKKILRSFISQCAATYLAGKLTATHPSVSGSLSKRVKGAGGYVRWLESDRNNQTLFYDAYCRLCNDPVPFDKIWDRSKP